MDFSQWLIEKKLRSRGPVGDLARDVAADEDVPDVANTHEAWRAHLQAAPENVLEVFEAAWQAYEAAVKRKACQ
ncbi:MAG: sterile alpha motif-like domain-containing protein [Acidobacteriia bacterium]|nr:sterile alpha motif-like domain-containing protein [Terriglobia bacterium]